MRAAAQAGLGVRLVVRVLVCVVRSEQGKTLVRVCDIHLYDESTS